MPRFTRCILSFTAFSFFVVGLGFAADARGLYSQFHDQTVKVYVAEATDSSKKHVMDPKAVKASIEEALTKRKSIHFEIAQDPSAADLLINTKVTEFMWTDSDPVDMIIGAAAAVYDAATIEDYARLQADISVMDIKSKKELWAERVMATVTKKPMSREESIPLVSEKLAKAFIRNCFSKKR